MRISVQLIGTCGEGQADVRHFVVDTMGDSYEQKHVDAVLTTIQSKTSAYSLYFACGATSGRITIRGANAELPADTVRAIREIAEAALNLTAV